MRRTEASTANQGALIFSMALIALGATVVALALRNLSLVDERPIYNAWTYVIAVPVGLILISIVSHGLLSRWLEWTLQGAFMLSLAIHMLFLAEVPQLIRFGSPSKSVEETASFNKLESEEDPGQEKQYSEVTYQPQFELGEPSNNSIGTAITRSELTDTEASNTALPENNQSDVFPNQDLSLQQKELEVPEHTPQEIELELQNAQPQEVEITSKTADLQRQQTDAPDTADLAQRWSINVPQQILDADPQAGSSAVPQAYNSELQSPNQDTFANQDLTFQQKELDVANQSPQALELQRQGPQYQQAEITSRAADVQRQQASSNAMLSQPSSINVPGQVLDSNLQPNSAVAPRQVGSEFQASNTDSFSGQNLPLQQKQLDVSSQGPQATAMQRQGPNYQPAEISSRSTDIGRQQANSPGAMDVTQLPSINVPGQMLDSGGPSQQDVGPRQMNTELSGPTGTARPSGNQIASAPRGPSGFESAMRPRDTSLGSSTGSGRASAGRQRDDMAGSLDRQLTGSPRSSRAMPRSGSVGGVLSPSDMLMNGSVPGIQAPGGSGSGQGSSGADQGVPNTDVASLGVDRSMSLDGGNRNRGGGQGNLSLGTPSAIPSPGSIAGNSPSGQLGISGPRDTSLQPRGSGQTGRSLASMSLPSATDRLPSQVGGGRSLPLGRADSGQLGLPTAPVPTPAFARRGERNSNASPDGTDLGALGPQTEAAIEAGLKFLAHYQRADGSWSLEDFGDRPLFASDTAATALSLLSFQGAGYSHLQYQYQDTCRRAIEFLVSHQTPDGDLYIPMNDLSDRNARYYSHGIAALALCEAYGMTQDERLRAPAQKSIDFLVASQDPRNGGWRYAPQSESDVSVTGWCMMAMKSAELAGLQVNRNSYRSIEAFLNNSQASENVAYLYRYNFNAADNVQTRHGLTPTPTMTGVGLLLRLYLGWKRDNENMVKGADYLLESVPEVGTVRDPKRDTYYWYYATQVMFHMGGDHWKKWNTALHPILIQSQVQKGRYTGSWDAGGGIPDRWGAFAGRLYVTTLNLLSLEVYYRHLPIYEETAK